MATAAAPVKAAVHAAHSTAPTEAGNRRLARREAIRLLAEARVPAHAVRVSRAPRGLPGPAEEPGTSSLFVRSRFWTVHLPFAAAVASVKAHPPGGLTAGSSSTGSGPHLEVAGFTYEPAVSPVWGAAEYEIELSRLTATTTGLRVDGVASWLDPRPIRDTARGRRLRVTTDAPCPAGDDRAVGVHSPGPFLTGQLLPRAQPTAAEVCTYSGGNSPNPFTLTRSRSLAPARARAVAAAVRAVPLGHDDGAVSSCPADFGDALVIAFSYPGRPDVDLWYPTTGCTYLANGHITAGSFDPGPVLTGLGR